MAAGNPYTVKWGIMATGGIAESQYLVFQSHFKGSNH